MSDQETEPDRVERAINFAGRQIFVTMPKPEQMVVWQRTLRQLADAENASWNGAQAIAALERLRKIIDSIIVNRIDVNWLDDQMLEGTVTLREMAGIVTKTAEAFTAEANNREERRAQKATPAKKATRKKA